MAEIDSGVDRTIVVLAAVQVQLSAEAASSSALSHTARVAISGQCCWKAQRNMRQGCISSALVQHANGTHTEAPLPMASAGKLLQVKSAREQEPSSPLIRRQLILSDGRSHGAVALSATKAAARAQQIAWDGRRSVQALPPRCVLQLGEAQAILLRQPLVFREVLKFSDGRGCGLAPASASPMEAAWPAGVRWC